MKNRQMKKFQKTLIAGTAALLMWKCLSAAVMDKNIDAKIMAESWTGAQGTSRDVAAL